MFGCKACKDKEAIIKLLTEQNQELFDRCMSFNKEAFANYNAEKRTDENLYPTYVDDKGKTQVVKDIDLKQAEQDILNIFGEEPVEVDK
jgi:hypothetical protein